MRHTYAALLIAEGAHPKTSRDRMGHSTVQVTIGHVRPCSRSPRTAMQPLSRIASTMCIARPSQYRQPRFEGSRAESRALPGLPSGPLGERNWLNPFATAPKTWLTTPEPPSSTTTNASPKSSLTRWPAWVRRSSRTRSQTVRRPTTSCSPNPTIRKRETERTDFYE